MQNQIIKAIKIDVENSEVKYVNVVREDSSILQSCYNHIGCELIDSVHLSDTNKIYVDDEGLLKLTPKSKFFIFDGVFQPLAGNGLILGHDNNSGESISTDLTIEEVAEKVIFADTYTLKTLGFI